MAERDDSLDRIGDRVASELGDGPDQARLAAQKRALIAEMGAAPGWRRRRWMFAAAALAIAGVMAVLVFLRRETTLDFSVGAEPGYEEPGEWFRNQTDEPLSMRFTDGSVIELGEEATARVLRADREEVRVDLSAGGVVAKIRPDEAIRWTIEAGPYRVTVLGTEFSMDWNPETSGLVVAVTRGLVLVEGQDLEPSGVELTDGQRLEIEGDAKRYAVGPTDEADEPTPATTRPEPDDAQTASPEVSREEPRQPVASEPAVIRAADEAPDTAGPESADVTDATEAGKPTWSELFERGDYESAVAAAREIGIDQLMATGTQVELRQFADAARYARKGKLAVDVLETLRERFPGTANARTAAFLLGRVAQELRGNPRQAKHWFETYLEEAPSGPLAEEALGRLVDASSKAGDDGAARRAASRYVDRYPEGVFAPLARAILVE